MKFPTFEKIPGIKASAEGQSNLKDFLIPLAFFAAGFLLFLAIALPKGKGFSALLSAKKESEEALGKISKKVSALKDNLKPYEASLNENFSAINHALPSEADVPGLMTQIEQIASSSGLIIEGLTFTSSSPEKKAKIPTEEGTEKAQKPKSKVVEEVTVQANLSGSYDSLLEFLKKVEETSRVILVNGVKLSPVRDQQEASNLYTATIEIASFFLPVGKEVDPEEPLSGYLFSKEVEEVLGEVKKLKRYEVSEP